MKPHRLVILTASLLASFATCPAVTLVSYLDNAFTAGNITNSGTSLAYSAVSANITASTLDDKTNPATASDADFSIASGTFFAKSSVIPVNSGDSATPWLTFNIRANTGYTLDLASLTFKFGGSNANGSGSVNYTPAYSVSYSFNNFATAGTSVGTGSAPLSIPFGTTNLSNTATVDLSSITGIAGTQTITFRISLSDNLNSGNTAYRLDDLALAGTVSAIPEPSAFALAAGSLALGLVLMRRRRA